MNLALFILVLFSVSRAEDVKSPSTGFEDQGAEKRENQPLEKRTTVLGPASPTPTPRIEYAQTKELHRDQSPAQQIYVSSSPAPQLQIAKISDVLTGQGPPFQSVIASHLYSPIPVYQPRLASPTIYEVSHPIPSQLAYSENLPLQPLPQPTTPPFGQRLQKPERVVVQAPPQPQVQSVFQQVKIAPQRIYQLPQLPAPVQLRQYPASLIPQPAYPQNQLQQVYSQIVPAHQNAQPGIVYLSDEKTAREEQRSLQVLKEGRPASKEVPALQPLQIQQQQVYNSQPHPQGAISYASFSHSQPAPSYQPQYQPQNQQAQAHQRQQLLNIQQYQNQIQQLRNEQQQLVNHQQHLRNQQQQLINHQQGQQLHSQQQQIQQQQFQKQQQQINDQQQQTQNQYDLRNQQQIYQVIPLSQIRILPPSAHIQAQYQEAQNQYQNLISAQPLVYKLEPAPANSVAVPVKALPAFVKPAPIQLQQRSLQQQEVQPQEYSASATAPGLVQTTGNGASFPAVQYFGKYAQAIFGAYPSK